MPGQQDIIYFTSKGQGHSSNFQVTGGRKAIQPPSAISVIAQSNYWDGRRWL